MVRIYVFNINTGMMAYTLDVEDPSEEQLNISEGFDYTLESPPQTTGTWMRKDSQWVELLPINNPYIIYNDTYVWSEAEGQWVPDDVLIAERQLREQGRVWEAIKLKRLENVMNGVLVESIGKTFHTDSMSAIQYSTIAGMAAMGTYEPVNWKVLDNSWVLLTVELLKELQIAISVKTNTNYEVAEQHKAAMLLVDNPLEYDYSTGWV